MAKVKKLERGDLGYFQKKKKSEFGNMLLYIAIGIVIFIVGLLLNKMEVTNVFTVLAILMVLPAARALVGVILLYPFHPIPLNQVSEYTAYAKEGDIVLYDAVFTSTEHAMHLDCIYITDHQVIGISSRENDNLDSIQKYFEKELKEHNFSYVVFLTKDKAALKKRMALRQSNDATKQTKATAQKETTEQSEVTAQQETSEQSEATTQQETSEQSGTINQNDTQQEVYQLLRSFIV